MQQARQLGTRDAVVAGNMNTEILPGSCVAALVESDAGEAAGDEEAALVRECASALRLGDEQPGAEQMAAWRGLRATAAAAPRDSRVPLRRVPTHGTRAAYDHGQTEGPCVSWRFDPGLQIGLAPASGASQVGSRERYFLRFAA